MKKMVFGLAASVLCAAYWWIVFTILYSDVMFAADRSPDAQPIAASEANMHSLVIIMLGIAIFTVLSVLWDRVTIRWRM